MASSNVFFWVSTFLAQRQVLEIHLCCCLSVLHPFSWLCSIPLMALTDVFAYTAIGGHVARAFSSTPPSLVVTQGCLFPSS